MTLVHLCMFQGRPRSSADLLIVHSLSPADLRLRLVHARHHRCVQPAISLGSISVLDRFHSGKKENTAWLSFSQTDREFSYTRAAITIKCGRNCFIRSLYKSGMHTGGAVGKSLLHSYDCLEHKYFTKSVCNVVPQLKTHITHHVLCFLIYTRLQILSKSCNAVLLFCNLAGAIKSAILKW